MIEHDSAAAVKDIFQVFWEEDISAKNYGWQLGKFALDFSFFIIITTIGLNIIFGIIVDTFSELRDR